jgi:hypothetical protein
MRVKGSSCALSLNPDKGAALGLFMVALDGWSVQVSLTA